MRKWIYPCLLFLLTLGVVLHYTVSVYDFSENSTLPNDASAEYKIYKLIIDGDAPSLRWGHTLIGSILTIWLPAAIQKATHINDALLFRYFSVPLIVWLPLIVYFIAKRYMSRYGAFLTGLLFVGQPYYMVATGVSRIIIATTFLVLASWVTLNEMKLKTKIICLAVLSMTLVVTHSGTAIASIVFVVGWLCLSFVLHRHWNAVSKKQVRDVGLFAGILGLFVALWFGIGIVTIGGKVLHLTSSVVSGVNTGRTDVLGASTILGFNFLSLDIVQRLEMIATWLVMLGIGIGLMMHLRKHYLFTAGAIIGLELLGLAVVSPSLGASYGIQRVYFHFSFLLLPFAIYGIVWLSKKIRLNQWIMPTGLACFYLVISFLGHI